MRAVLIKDGKGPVENLYLGEAPKPSPKPSEVLVKVRFRQEISMTSFQFLFNISALAFFFLCSYIFDFELI